MIKLFLLKKAVLENIISETKRLIFYSFIMDWERVNHVVWLRFNPLQYNPYVSIMLRKIAVENIRTNEKNMITSILSIFKDVFCTFTYNT